jgi:uncharacterized protein
VGDASSTVFHHAFPVRDLVATRDFYGRVLGCSVGRRDSERAVDFDFFGHHVIAHLVDGGAADLHRQAADGASVAVRHFGVVIPWDEWEALVDRLRAQRVPFIVEPEVRHPGEPREEALMLVADPSGNGIEFKTFRDRRFLFADD